MGKQALSAFKDKPVTKCGWTGFLASLIALLSGPILGISAALFIPFLSESINDEVGAIIGFSLMIFIYIALIVALACSLRAFIKGERSWAVLFALAVSGLSVLFWMLFIVGEFLFPH